MDQLSRRTFLTVSGTAFAGAAVFGISGGVLQAEAVGRPGGASITRRGNIWVLENDVLRIKLDASSGGMWITSIYNKEASQDYQASRQPLFSYEFDGTTEITAEDGWEILTPRVSDLWMHTVQGRVKVGRELRIPLRRTAPQPITVTAVFDLYDGRSGWRFHTLIRNDSADKTTITNSTVLALGLPDRPHRLHYPPNMRWKSTTGSLSPVPEGKAELPKKVITVYAEGHGWSLSPEVNWKTQRGKGNYPAEYMLPPFAALNAWHEIDHVRVTTNPQSLQLVLFPGEEFEYLSVNLSVFTGDVIDAKMAEEEHFRRRFRYNNVSTLFNTNDWDYRGGPGSTLPDNYYYDVIIPKAKRARFDMVMLDDLWNTTRDSIEPSAVMAKSIRSLDEFSRTVTDTGMRLGLWYSLSGGGHVEGRDLADPVQLQEKRAQIETLITQYRMSHQMVDLTEWWQNESVTTYSHPSDNVYRKAVLSRRLLNDLVEKYPHYLPKMTSELDIWPTQGDRNTSLLHVAYNGWNTANGGITGEDLSLRTAVTGFGHLPMSSAYMNGGQLTGRMEDYYSYLAVRNVKFGQDPGKPGTWPDAAVDLMAAFNRWRKHPRIARLTEQPFRPVYLGSGWDGTTWNSSTGPFVWLWTDDDRGEALVIATGKGGYASTVVADLRWLRPGRRYAVADISLDDDGSHTYAYRGTFSTDELKEFPIDLRTNTSRGKAFWIRETQGRNLHVLYPDENITSFQQHGSAQRIELKLTGTAGAQAVVVVVDPRTNRGLAKSIQLNASGKATATIKASELLPPAPVSKVFAEPIYREAEFLPRTADATATEIGEPNASNGAWILANLTAVGQSVQYTVDVPADGLYQVDVRYKENESRGRSQLSVDGIALGLEADHFQPRGMYKGIEFRERRQGNLQLTKGNHSFRFTSTGRTGTSYAVGVDYVKLTPTAAPARLTFEAETSFTATSATVVTTADPAASKGQWHALKATTVGDWVEYSVTIPAAGRYRISSVVKAHAERGQAQLLVNGTQLGEVFDEYLAPADGSYQYREVTHGEVDLPAGYVVLRYRVTGRNQASASYGLATDQILLSPVPRLTLAGKGNLRVGEQAAYTVGYLQFEPYYAQNRYLLWTVEQESTRGVLTIDQNGVAQAATRGSAVVRVTSQIDPTATATVAVTVG
ncbi:carbohydrate-binding protein [Kribbella qitaiheensis]